MCIPEVFGDPAEPPALLSVPILFCSTVGSRSSHYRCNFCVEKARILGGIQSTNFSWQGERTDVCGVMGHPTVAAGLSYGMGRGGPTENKPSLSIWDQHQALEEPLSHPWVIYLVLGLDDLPGADLPSSSQSLSV